VIFGTRTLYQFFILSLHIEHVLLLCSVHTGTNCTLCSCQLVQQLFLMASPRKTGKKSKARDHHLEEQATATKKARANELSEPRRSSRSGAGSGGKASQLKKIGAALEAPSRFPKTTTTLPNGSSTNPLAPVPAKKGRKKKLPTQVSTYLFL